MIYNLTNIFTKINATSGTLQNDSSRYAIEISNSTVNGSGFLLFPQASTTFNGTTLYARSVGAGGAVLRYVPFSVGEGQGGFAGGGSSVEQIVPDDSVASDDEIDDVVDDIFWSLTPFRECTRGTLLYLLLTFYLFWGYIYYVYQC